MSEQQPVPPVAKQGRCMHSTATLGPHARTSCQAGVVYADLVGTEPGWAGRLPCSRLRQHETRPPVPCALRQEPTDAQIDAWRAFADEVVHATVESVRRIQRERQGTGAYEGAVTCPTCGGRVRWTMAKSNNHITAVCEKAGCVSFMQ